MQRFTQSRHSVTVTNTHNGIHGFLQLGLRGAANAPSALSAWIVRPYTWTGTPAGGANSVTIADVPAGATLIVRRAK